MDISHLIAILLDTNSRSYHLLKKMGISDRRATSGNCAIERYKSWPVNHVEENQDLILKTHINNNRITLE